MKSDDFDPEWYRSQYPDVVALGMDPEQHFNRYGRRLGRQGSRNGSKLTGSEPLEQSTAAPTPVAASPIIDIRDHVEKEWVGYRGRAKVMAMLSRQDLPLVSVVMTSHNAQDTVEAAVESILMQSYPNLEVIICDDASSDRTWEILQSIQVRTGGTVKAIRLARNSGTYLAKNVAIDAAQGDFVLFQDSDDYSHCHRVACQIEPLIDDVTLIGTRTKYARFNPETFKAIPREGEIAKLGLITVCVRRRAFSEIGYFDAVRKAGDDEWFRRLRHLYGSHSVRDLQVSLYCAELRSNSLIADMVQVQSDGSIKQSSSASRRAYVKLFSERLKDKAHTQSWYKTHFPVFPSRAQQNYPPEIEAIAHQRDPIIGAVCSIPSRVDAFRCVIARILPQVDELHVYLDKYSVIPDFLDSKKITIYRSENFDVDFRDNAKFIAYNECKNAYPDGFYYFTFDDDIIYPHDYVRHLLNSVNEYDRCAVVGVHGVILVEAPQKYSRQRVVFHFSADDVNSPVLVNNLGTGTVAFWSAAFDSLDPNMWGDGGMVDIDFSIVARRCSVPMVAVQRHAGWLELNELPEGDVPLFQENSRKENIIKSKLEAAGPWGFIAIRSTLETQSPNASERLEKLLPRFVHELSVKQFFERMRRKG